MSGVRHCLFLFVPIFRFEVLNLYALTKTITNEVLYEL